VRHAIAVDLSAGMLPSQEDLRQSGGLSLVHRRRRILRRHRESEAIYGQPAQLPADAAAPKMTRLRREHHRLLGNGWCTRPSQPDCAFESICETCSHFQTSIEFRPTLQSQQDHAAQHDQPSRQQLFAELLSRVDTTQAS
jgi:hypothetical protein